MLASHIGNCKLERDVVLKTTLENIIFLESISVIKFEYSKIFEAKRGINDFWHFTSLACIKKFKPH